ncbi:hypothetical protein [Mucilaginibacter pocheonensis]|uniref:Lipoprotein n=1 Tax=Mucilaginibacter pocheonensis TaxID=398050 RepID=A0ABU1TCL7_9SPHI|nr:hypothetical protein [Mucilaginibacter pocheonensis]MDR6943143.1 hypothetical protein [Mucilaginibacter pocheonensis]
MKKIFYLICFCGFLSGCSAFKNAGSSLGQGFNSQTRSIGKNLIIGIDSGLVESAIRADLYKTLDSAIIIAGSSTNKNLKKVLDSLLTKRWSVFVKQLVEDASGQQTRKNIENLREALIGAKSKAEVQALIAAVLNDETNGKLVTLKNKLLGDETRKQVSDIIDTGMQHFTTRFQAGITDSTLLKLSHFLNNDLNKSLDSNLSIIQKYATWFLVGIGVVAAFIITLVWINRQKYLKLSTLMASQVNAIPDQQMYDQLTARIKQSAVTAGVEPTLRNILDKNNLLGNETWKPVV